MNKNFITLYKKYQAIRKMDWIENMRNGYSGIGYTFETLIGKEEDTLPIPDYGEIEIKVNRTFSKNEIHLFTTVPDGDYLFPMERVLEKLGYPDKKYNFFKVLNMDFKCKEYTHIGKYRMAKIEIDRNNNKINLVAKDFKGQPIDVGISWSFNLLRERLYLKLKELVIIEANVKKINNKEFFFYKKINYYLLKSFDTFLDLIENGIITIGFKIGYHTEENKFGTMKSRGTVFSINFKNIENLYRKVPLKLFEYQLL